MTFATRPTVPTPILFTVLLMEKSGSVLPLHGLPSNALSREESNSPAFSKSPSFSSPSSLMSTLLQIRANGKLNYAILFDVIVFTESISQTLSVLPNKECTTIPLSAASTCSVEVSGTPELSLVRLDVDSLSKSLGKGNFPFPS